MSKVTGDFGGVQSHKNILISPKISMKRGQNVKHTSCNSIQCKISDYKNQIRAGLNHAKLQTERFIA